MNIIQTETLSEMQKEEIGALIAACKESAPKPPAFPMEQGSSFYLLYDPDLVSALSLTYFGEAREEAECLALTLPGKRRKGYFSILFEQAEAAIQDTDVWFLTDGSDEGTLKALESLGAEPEHQEHRMELDFKKTNLDLSFKSNVPCLTFNVKEIFPADQLFSDGETLAAGKIPLTGELSFRFYIKSTSDAMHSQPVGSCHITLYKASASACLHHVLIEESFRGMGFGKQAIYLTLAYLKDKNIHTVFLNVTGHNEPAMRLYEKTGFRITETLSYYLY